jgi:PST family polysaccharide transporter
MAFVPFVVALNIPAYQTLLAFNFQKSYMSVLLAGSLLNILLNIILSNLFSMMGTAWSVIVTELFITCGLYIILQRNHKHYSPIFAHFFVNPNADANRN